MSERCANTPLVPSDDKVTAVEALRRQLLAQLYTRRLPLVEPMHPLVAYTILFGERPHPSIENAVYSALRSPDRVPVRGHLYIFRDERDAELALVKIGRSNNVARRLAEWRHALNGGFAAVGEEEAGAAATPIVLIFSSSTGDAPLAERILHALLTCQWVPNRVRRATGERLLEYFRVPNLDALRLLTKAVARYASWYAERLLVRRHAFDGPFAGRLVAEID